MRSLMRTVGNAALVVVGFFAVFFGVGRVSNHSGHASDGGVQGVAYADAPSSCGDGGNSCSDSSDSSDSGACGDSSDSGDCSCGK